MAAEALTPIRSSARVLACSALFTCTAQLLWAQGGPPMLTDDPDTLGAGRWEINLANIQLRTKDARSRSLPHLDVNYGLSDRVQLKYETGWVFANDPDGVRSGLDNSLIGVRWRFADQEKTGVNISIYPQLQLENPTGSVARGIAEPGPNGFLPVEVSRDFGALKLVGELGFQYRRNSENQWIYGVLAAVPVSEDLELMSEVRVFGETLSRHDDVVLNIGLRKGLGSQLRLLAAVGTGLANRPESTSLLAYLGIQLTLGKDRL